MKRFSIFLLSVCLLSLSGCAALLKRIGAEPYDAVVDASYMGKPGAKTFKTIQAALDDAPTAVRKPYRIQIRNGRYIEKLVITKAFITFIGEDREKTIVTFDAAAGGKDPSGKLWGPAGSATLTIRATDFSAEDMTIENSFDYPKNFRKDATDTTRIRETQAAAVMTDAGADRSLFQNVKVLGYQTTLFLNSGRSYFVASSIAGHVDIIAGAGQSTFVDSEIVSRPRTGQLPMGYVTAPSTPIGNQYGFVFINSRLIKESAEVQPDSVPLGRPWHPTATFVDGRYADPNAVGNTVYINCFMEDHITEAGWDQMGGIAKDGIRIFFAPQQARFFEYKSSGPGAKVNSSRRQLTDTQAKDYSVDKILGDWKAGR